MKPIMITPAVALCVLAGCSRPMPPEAPRNEPENEQERDKVEIALPEDGRAERHGHEPGDFVVYRFSGSYREDPIELTHRVVARRGEVLVVDVTFDGRIAYRLEVDDRPQTRGAILSVARIVDGEAKPVDRKSYDLLMSSLIMGADENEGLIDDEKVDIDLGEKTVEAEKHTYRVVVDGRVGFMSTLTADGFLWGDAGGEIRTADGDLIYKAEVVDVGHVAKEPIATGEPYDTIEGLDYLDE